MSLVIIDAEVVKPELLLFVNIQTLKIIFVVRTLVEFTTILFALKNRIFASSSVTKIVTFLKFLATNFAIKEH